MEIIKGEAENSNSGNQATGRISTKRLLTLLIKLNVLLSDKIVKFTVKIANSDKMANPNCQRTRRISEISRLCAHRIC